MNMINESKYVFNSENIKFKYIQNPDLQTKMRIIDDIVFGVINDTTGYQPILFDYFVVVALITNITDIKLPESFEESASIIEESELKHILFNLLGNTCISSIIDNAEKKIEYEKVKYSNKSSADELFEELTSLVKKYGDLFSGLDINAVYDNMTKIAQLANMDEKNIVKGILAFREANE